MQATQASTVFRCRFTALSESPAVSLLSALGKLTGPPTEPQPPRDPSWEEICTLLQTVIGHSKYLCSVLPQSPASGRCQHTEMSLSRQLGGRRKMGAGTGFTESQQRAAGLAHLAEQHLADPSKPCPPAHLGTVRGCAKGAAYLL